MTWLFSLEATSYSVGGAGLVNFSTSSRTVGGNWAMFSARTHAGAKISAVAF